MKTLEDFLVENIDLEDKVISSEEVNGEEKTEFESGDCNISLVNTEGSYSDFEYLISTLALNYIKSNTDHSLSNQRTFYRALQENQNIETALGKAIINSLIVSILTETVEKEKSSEELLDN